MAVPSSSISPAPGGRPVVFLLSLAEVALFGAGIIASIVLVAATLRSERLTNAIGTSVNSVHAASQAERALLMHARHSHLHLALLAHAASVHEKSRDRAGKDLAHWLATLEQFSETPHEAAALKTAVEQAEEYQKAHDAFLAQGLSEAEMTPRLVGLVEKAQESLGRLVELNLEQARGLERQVKTEDRLAIAIGWGSGILLALFLTGVFLLLHRQLRRPLTTLQARLTGVEANRLAPIPVEGPQELQSVAAAFNRLVRELLERGHTQMRVIAHMAYQLRSPIQQIKQASHQLPELSGPEPTAAAKTFQDGLHQLDKNVQEFIEITRIESGQLDLNYTEFDLFKLTESTVRVMAQSTHIHEFKLLNTVRPLMVRLDATRVAQVLSNLLSNAIKYSPVGGDILVTLTAQEERVTLAVQDHGMGISPEDLPFIFEPFRRTPGTRDSILGTGLGLSVVQKIVAAHHGTLQVTSTPRQGSLFAVTLPRHALRLEPAPAVTAAAA